MVNRRERRHTVIEKALNKQGLIKKNTGRHDWTRTNDPHHVKVVL